MFSMETCEEFQGDLIFLLFLEDSENIDANMVGFILNLENPYGILDYVRRYKDEGNHLFKQQKFEEALEKYDLGAKFLTFISFRSEEDRSIFWELAFSISLNLAVCCLKIKDFVQAGRLCSVVLRYNSRSVKALFRRACAAMELGRTDLALLDLNSACEIEPSNKEVANKLAEVKNLMLYSPIQEVQESTPAGLGSSSGLTPLKKTPRKRVQEEEITNHENLYKSSPSSCKKNVKGDMHQSSLIQPEKTVNDHDDVVKVSSDASFKTEEVDTFKNSSRNGQDEVNSLSSEEMNNLAEPKYRLYNRKRLGSFLIISQKDYQLITQGKPISYINSRTGSCVTIRSVRRQRDIAKQKDMGKETSREYESKVEKAEGVMETTPVTVQSEDWMDESEDNNPMSGQAKGNTQWFSSNSNEVHCLTTPSKATRGRGHHQGTTPTKWHKRRKLLINKNHLLSPTNFCCDYRFVQGKKRKCEYPPPIDTYRRRKRERNNPQGCRTRSSIRYSGPCVTDSDVSCNTTKSVVCVTHEMVDDQSNG